jgi:hypothetical protein
VRVAHDFKWGVPVDFDPATRLRLGHALSNYLTLSGI